MRELKENVKIFEEASGIRINSCGSSNRKMGDAVKFIENGGCERIETQLKQLKQQAEGIVNHIAQTLNIQSFKDVATIQATEKTVIKS